MVKVVWTERAVDDLTSIATYCERHSPKYAASIVSKLFNKVDIFQLMLEDKELVSKNKQVTVRIWDRPAISVM